MLPGSRALQALTPKDRLQLQRGSCLRHRYAKADCRTCFDICRNGAFTWNESGLAWDPGACQGCLLCAAACPSGALRGSEIDFVALLQELKDLDRPILACTTLPQTEGHARLPCLGILANTDLLLALQLALDKPLRLNLTACTNCQNGRIIQSLQHAIKQIQQVCIPRPGRIEAILDESRLQFQERTCSRRDFFNLLRHRSQRAGLCIVDRLQPDAGQGTYGAKQLPFSRLLLVQVFEQFPEPPQNISQHLFPRRSTGVQCRGCTGCVGICPTGALTAQSESAGTPAFSAAHCIACGLCETFCTWGGIKIIPCRSQPTLPA